MQPRLIRLLLVFACVLSIVGVSYAVTRVTVQNSSIINAGQNMFITQPTQTNLGTCPADGSPSYTQSPTSITWNLTAGAGGVNYFFCIDNQGPVSDPVNITPAPSTSITTGTCPSTGNTLVMNSPIVVTPSTLPGHSTTTAPVDIQVCAGSSMTPTATGPTFTITVQ